MKFNWPQMKKTIIFRQIPDWNCSQVPFTRYANNH